MNTQVMLIGALAGVVAAFVLVLAARRRHRAGLPLPLTGPEGRGAPHLEAVLEAAVWVLGALVVVGVLLILGPLVN